MDKTVLSAKARDLKARIDAPDVLVLPNVWDVAGARIVAEEGYPIIATSSAGIAWSLGFADGENISRETMLFMVERIAATTDLPVTADLEAGYGTEPEAIASTIGAAIQAGAVGANFEDSQSEDGGHRLLDFELSVERIRAGRAQADEMGIPFVINARTDGFFDGNTRSAFLETVRRANAYLEAGARCIFVPFVRDGETIGNLVRSIQGPVNILAGAQSPSLPVLQELGVARVSIGGLFSLKTYSVLRAACRHLSARGNFEWAEDVIMHPEMNALMARA